MADLPHRYITIEGPIGVGKTSLARRIAGALDLDLLLEQADENPFLERYYRDPENGALPTQLHFLFQRSRQLADMQQHDLFSRGRVADFLMEKDRLFASVTLSDLEFDLYQQVYERVSVDAPAPDIVVYLQAPAVVLMQRIRKRGIQMEQGIDRDYLTRLSDAYTSFFHRYEASPLLIVNAGSIDPVNDDNDFEQLMDRILSVRTGRHYFNPAPAAGMLKSGT